ncbi:MAG: acyltransferase, partial [Porphyrobacter sp.]|nr:acyltransferase [Porphyrobacter sp.]
MGQNGLDEQQEAGSKIVAIQLLRVLPALVVVTGHIAFAFADHIGSGLGIAADNGQIGHAAVMVFFIVSGYVMVVSSRDFFGRAGARRVFWTRRFTRVMPPYWIASGIMALIFLTLFPTPIDGPGLLRSLLLIPFWPEGGGLRPVPFLWVGWTLFYEMVFYFWFGLFVSWRREAALMAVAAVLGAMVIAGFWVPPDNAILFVATRPISLMFLVGAGLALWREGGGRAPPAIRWLALLAIVPVLASVPVPAEVEAMGFDVLLWCALPAFLLAFAVLAGPLAVPAPAFIDRAGDVSYAIYLLHVPVAWFWLWFWGRLPFFDAGPWDYLVSALVAVLGLSWLFFAQV